MALKKETIQKIASYLKLKEDELETAIKDTNEVDLPVGEFTVFTNEEISSRDEQKLSEGKKEGQKAGENIGKEIAVKEMKKAFGVEFEGKDLVKLVDTVKGQLAKGDDGLKEQIKLLQQKNTEYEAAIETSKKEAEAARFDAEILTELPANRTGLLSDKQQLLLLKTEAEFTEEGVKYNGQILRDSKTQNPLSRKDALAQIYNEKKWVNVETPPPGGRGGGNVPPSGKASKYSELVKEWEQQGKSIGTAEFQTHLNSVVKANPEFQFDPVQ